MTDITGRVNKNAFDFFKKDQLEMLYQSLLNARNNQQILFPINAYLINQITPSKEDKRLKYAIDLLYNQKINTVTQLREAINLSTVSTRNPFHKRVGRTPQEIIKILRIHKTLQTPQPLHTNLTQLAYSIGHCDQSLFIIDFKRFFGFSPGHYFNDPELTFDFYIDGRWNGNIFEQNI